MSFYLGSLMIVKYAVEARAYGVLMMITGLTLCCWQSYARTGDRWALGGVALGISGAILSHQYGILVVGLPLVAGEAIRSVRLRCIDTRLLAAGAIGASTILLTFPPTLRGQRLLLDAIRDCPVFSGHPLLRDLRFYGWMLPALIPLLMVLAVLLSVPVLALYKSKLEVDSVDDCRRPEDLAVASALALLLPVMLVVTHFGTRYFQSRYGIGSAMGVAILVGMLLERVQTHWRHAASLALAGTIYSLIVGLFTISIANVTMWNIFPWTDPVLHAGDFSNHPLVVANALEFSPLWWYSDEHQRRRLHFLSDLPFAAQQSAGLPEYSLALEREISRCSWRTIRRF